MSMWKVVRTELKDKRRMTPERRKEICRDQASWSNVGSRCLARSERIRFIGSVVEDVRSGVVKRLRRRDVKVVVKIR